MSPQRQAFLVILDLAELLGWPDDLTTLNNPDEPTVHTVVRHIVGHPDEQALLVRAGLRWTRLAAGAPLGLLVASEPAAMWWEWAQGEVWERYARIMAARVAAVPPSTGG